MAEWERDYVNREFAKLREAFGGVCQECGVSPAQGAKLEFAHVKPTKLKGNGRGKRKRLYDIQRHRECYRLLCVACHADMDARAPALKEEW